MSNSGRECGTLNQNESIEASCASVNSLASNGQQNRRTSQDEAVPIHSDFTRVETFKDLSNILTTKTNCFLHFKVQRKRTKCSLYYHHFIFYDYSATTGGFEGTIAHYTSTGFIIFQDIGIAKFIKEKYKLLNNGDKDENFDFEHGLSFREVNERSFVVNIRLEQCVGDTLYDLTENNCEHAVNYILYGKSKSEQSSKTATCCNCLTKIKEVGLRSAVIISLVASLAATFTRYSYVRLTVMILINIFTKSDLNVTCPTSEDNVIIEEAKRVLIEKNELPHYNNIQNADTILNTILEGFNTSFACLVANDLTKTSIENTIYIGFLIGLCVEIIFVVIIFASTFSIVDRVGCFYLWKSIFLRIISGTLSLGIGVCTGAVSAYKQTDSSPAGYFVLVCFFCTLKMRILIFVILSCLFGCCQEKCAGRHCCRCCYHKKRFINGICFFIVAGLCVAIYLVLKQNTD